MEKLKIIIEDGIITDVLTDNDKDPIDVELIYLDRDAEDYEANTNYRDTLYANSMYASQIGNAYSHDGQTPNTTEEISSKAAPLIRSNYEICEDCGWSVSEDCNTVTLCHESLHGEDFSFTVDAEGDFVDAVKEYSAYFDPDEHVEMWIQAKVSGMAGVPSAKELVEDAEYISKMLQELASKLWTNEDALKNTPSFTAFAYEDDGVTTADLSSYDTAEEAVSFAKSRNWDEVVNDTTGEIVWHK